MWEHAGLKNRLTVPTHCQLFSIFMTSSWYTGNFTTHPIHPLMNILLWWRWEFQISFSGRDMSMNFGNRLWRNSMVGTVIYETKWIPPPLSRILQDILEDGHIQWHHPLIRHFTHFWPCYWAGPYYRILLYLLCEVSIEHFKWVQHDNRGRLLLQTLGPVPVWDFLFSNVETNRSWTCLVSRLCVSNITLILLWLLTLLTFEE